MQSYKKNKK
jgi:hypothetical protein